VELVSSLYLESQDCQNILIQFLKLKLIIEVFPLMNHVVIIEMKVGVQLLGFSLKLSSVSVSPLALYLTSQCFNLNSAETFDHVYRIAGI
jgi:hypothetical protein